MSISKRAFIVSGVILWGIPMGIIVAIISACISPGTFFKLQNFEFGLFLKRLLFFVPPFAVLGIFVGLMLFKVSKKHIK